MESHRTDPRSIVMHAVRALLAMALGVFFIRVGLLHFTDTDWFAPIVPHILGCSRFWVLLSGVIEIVLGVGLIIPASQKPSAAATAIFVVLVYPANLNMWINNLSLGDGTTLTLWGHVIRLALQMIAIAFCLWIARKR